MQYKRYGTEDKKETIMILAIDFDGTICRGLYPNIDGLQPYAKETIKKLKEDGHYIIINTCRSGEQLLETINWLLEHGIPFDRVNDNAPEQITMYGNNCRKIFADIYIDDRQIGGLPSWLSIYEYIKTKKNA